MKWSLIVSAFLLVANPLLSQKAVERPKLVVGIVVDQMRNDYLHRYRDHFTGGFKRMQEEGYTCANHHFSYIPTVTGPGHASVYTGTTPAVHGIAANNWYDPRTKEGMYCVQDKSVRTIGIDNADGQMSPFNLKTTTITDELMLTLNFRSKVVGLSIKDRGAILPAGHLGKAYWHSKGQMISSSYYVDALPDWVTAFNARDLVSAYLKEGWDPLLPLEAYRSSTADDSPYETKFVGEEASLLPRNLEALVEANGRENVFKRSPHGNAFLLDFAKAALEGEALGKDEDTDFLCISFSTPDYMGHAMGTRAVEIEDMYIRLDRALGAFFDHLDREVGKGEYLVFLTSDHGAADVPQFSMDLGLPGGYVDMAQVQEGAAEALMGVYPGGMDFIEQVQEDRLFLDKAAIRAAGADYDEVCRVLADALRDMPGIYNAYPTAPLLLGGGVEWPLQNLLRGLYPPLAGDVVAVLESGWIKYGPTGTTHGSGYRYDSHVPLLFMGKGIPVGKTFRETHIRDIAPTLSMMLDISLPSGATGAPIQEVLVK